MALALVNGSASRKLFDHQPGPTDEVSVVNKMASDEQRTWGTTDPYMEIAVHQDYAIRLAQMNFAPEPAPHSSETKP